MDPEGLTDEALVARVCGGEQPLFELLVRRHNQRLYRVARSIVRDDREAEDVVQEAYVSAFLHLGSFEGRSRFSTWLTRITARQALARVHRSSEALSDREEEVMTDRRASPESQAHDRELLSVMEAAIDTLPPDFRSVFVLRAVEELSTAEAAACLEIPEQTVKTRLHRARRLLQEELLARLERSTTELYAFQGHRCDRLTAAVMARLQEVR